MLDSPFGGASPFGRRRDGFNPYSVGDSLAAFYDPAEKPSLRTTLAGGGAVNLFGEVVGTVRDRSGKGLDASALSNVRRPLYARAPVGGVRNLARGAGAVGDVLYWDATRLNNGITSAKIASGTDPADGLPYADYRSTGTSTAASIDLAYLTTNSRVPATLGQTFTASFIASRIGGSATNVVGIRPIIAEETAPSTFLSAGVGVGYAGAGEAVQTVSRTLSSGGVNQVRGTVQLLLTGAGVTIDVTFRIKAFQFEVGAARTAYQSNISAADISEVGKADRFALLFDGVDDALAVTLPAGTYTVAYGDDAGVTITPGVVHGGGAYTLPAPARLYGAVVIDRALTAAETVGFTELLQSRRP